MKIKAKFILFSAILLTISFMIFRYISIKPNVKVKTGVLKTLSTEEKLKYFGYIYSILKENFPYFEIKKRKRVMIGYSINLNLRSGLKTEKIMKNFTLPLIKF